VVENVPRIPDAGALPFDIQDWVFTNGGGNSQTSLSHNIPAGTKADELLLAVTMHEDAIGDTELTTATTGWTRRTWTWSAAADVAIGLFTKTAVGGDANLVVDCRDGNIMGWVFRIPGANTTNPINVSNYVAAGAAASHVIGEVTPLVDGCIPMYALVGDGSTTTPYLPHSVSGGTWVEEDEQSTDNAQTNQIHGSLGFHSTKIQETAAATGDATVTPAVTDGACYFQIAIAPA
jgi:hypothetical protein